MYRSGAVQLGFSLKPPAWLRSTVAGIFQRGTAGGISVPTPGGGSATYSPPSPADFQVSAPMLAGGAGLALGALALFLLMGRRGR